MAFKAAMKRAVSIAKRDSQRDDEEDDFPPLGAGDSLSEGKRGSVEGKRGSNGLESTSALDRFATLKDKLKLMRVRSNNGGKLNRMGSNRIGDLVEEARLNRSAVIDDLSISASELKNQMQMNMKRATNYREIQEYGRKVPIPLPPDLLSLPRLAAWHYCIRHMDLLELNNGQTLISKGQEGRFIFFLLTGGVLVNGEMKDDILPLSILGEEALSGIPYIATVTAKAEKGQSTFVARLNVNAYTEALKEAEACRSSRSRQLFSLLLTSKSERTPIHMRDMAAQLSIIEVFRTMEPEVRLELCNFIEALSVPAGSTLFREGDKVCFCYVILQGSVVFTRQNPDTQMAEEIGLKLAGEHFGTLSTLSNPDKKRLFTATAREDCSFAIISRVGYSRISRNQIQNDINARADLIRGMHLFSGGSKHDNNDQAINRIAFNSQREDFPSGHVLVNPSCYPNKVFIIMEGSCRLVWQTDSPLSPPPLPMSIEQHMALYHPGQALKKIDNQGDVSPRRPKRSPRGDAKGKRESHGYESSKGGGKDDDDIAQQMGNLAGNRTCGCGANLASQIITTSTMNPMSGSKGKQMTFDLAHLGTGDLINGDILLGMAPALTVIASSSLKVMSIEVDAVESTPLFSIALQSMVRQQWELNSKRLRDTVAVRRTLAVGSSAYHRTIEDDREVQSKFLDHYIPHDYHQVQKPSAAASSNNQGPSASSQKAQTHHAQTLPASSHMSYGVDATRPQAVSSLGFSEICTAPLSTFRNRPSANGSRQDSKKKQSQSAMAILQNAAATATPSTRAREETHEGKGKGWRRGPNSLAPSTFAGHMHPLIGDLMGFNDPKTGSEWKARTHQAELSLTIDSQPRSNDDEEGPGRLPDPTAPYQAPDASPQDLSSSQSPHASPSPVPPYRPHFTLPNAIAKSRSSSPLISMGNPLLDSPVLMSKVAKLQPVTSKATAAYASSREAAILSVGRGPSNDLFSLPMLGLAPTTPPQGASRAGEEVAILPQHMSSYECILPLRDSNPSPVTAKKVIRSKMGLSSPSKQAGYSHGILSPMLIDKDRTNSGQFAGGSVAVSREGSVASMGGWEEKQVNKQSGASQAMFERMSSKRDMMAFSSNDSPGPGESSYASSNPNSLARLGTSQRASLRVHGSVRDQPGGTSFKVRSVKAWRRPEEDLELPLDRDALAPSLKDHPVSSPSIHDINYILRRWDNQWESDRQEARRKLRELKERNMARHDEDDEDDEGGGMESALWDLDQFGAPTFSPGL